MESLSFVTLLVAGISAVVAGVVDVRTYRVPNLLTIPVLASGMAFHAVTSGWSGVQSASLGAVCVFAVMFFLFVIGVMGAGDVKLMAGIGAWLGLMPVFYVLFIAALCNAVYSLWALFRQGGLRRVYLAFQVAYLQVAALGKFVGDDERIEKVVRAPDQKHRLVPFAAMIAVGVSVIAVWQVLPLNVVAMH